MSSDEETHLSVAIFNFAMADKSSWLVAALTLVRGVLPPSEPVGVEAVEVVPANPEFFFAAFSASRFCFEAEGGIVVERQGLQLGPAIDPDRTAPQIFD